MVRVHVRMMERTSQTVVYEANAILHLDLMIDTHFCNSYKYNGCLLGTTEGVDGGVVGGVLGGVASVEGEK